MTQSQTADIRFTADPVSWDNADQVREDVLELLRSSNSDQLTLDCATMVNANSVSVALLVAWHRFAVLHGRQVRFVNLNARLHEIIHFSGLAGLLAIDEAVG